ncbi:MAG: ABC transporter permease subunit, partial [Bacteroidetes bacterium]
MLKYLFKRILLFIPTLLAISLLTFFISINAPGDPVEVMLNRADGSGESQSQKSARDKDYAELRHKMGFDKPLFYCSLTDETVSDTLYKISKIKHRTTLKRLSNKYGNWENVSLYYKNIQEMESILHSFETSFENENDCDIKGKILIVQTAVNELYNQFEEEKINTIIAQLRSYDLSIKCDDSIGGGPCVTIDIASLEKKFQKLVSEKNSYTKYIPVIHWYGFNNQYHRWITNFLTGDFGISYQDKREVSSVVYAALGRTLGISLLSLVLAYLIAIPLGIHSAVKKGTQGEKTITTTLFLLYSLPNFWIATMLVVFLCGGDYLSWFPTPGSAPIPDDSPFWYKLTEGAYRLILPLFCWTYGSLAFISRQMRGGILSSITQDYIQTARAKGLDENQVIRKHALKNSLLPVITLFATIFPLAISGSFVIENIFNIPGMGKLSLEALYARDYPVIFTVMMFTAILTMAGNLIGDLLYALVDP